MSFARTTAATATLLIAWGGAWTRPCPAEPADHPRPDSTAKPADDELAAAAAFLQTMADSLEVKLEGAKDESFQPRSAPLLKYSDPARGYPAAGVWRLGQSGRPRALVSLEYWRRGETEGPRLMYEFMSLSPARFELESKQEGTLWQTDETAPDFVPLPGLAKPAARDAQRLIQLRKLARRFSVSEREMGEFAELRLLPQPIDRYSDPNAGIRDGATFVFAYGTNPELAVLLECDENTWRYALLRMSWAELVVEFDGREAARFAQIGQPPASGPYRTVGHAIRPPGEQPKQQ